MPHPTGQANQSLAERVVECACVLEAEGMDQQLAMRACSVSAWQFPDQDAAALAARARHSSQNLSVQAEEPVVALEFACSKLQEVGPNSPFFLTAQAIEQALLSAPLAPGQVRSPRIFREAHMIHEGTFNGFPFTKKDLDEMYDTFREDRPPPIQLDHSRSVEKCHGRLRAIRKYSTPTGKSALMGLVEVIGQHGVERVSDRRWENMSLGVLMRSPKRISEFSFVTDPAVNNEDGIARILSYKEDPMPNTIPGTGAGNPGTAPVPSTQPAQPAQPAVGLLEEFAARLGFVRATGTSPTPPVPAPEPAPTPANAEKTDDHSPEVLAKVNDLEAEVNKLRANEEKRAVEDLFVAFCKAGKSCKAMMDEEIKLLKAMTPEARLLYAAVKDKQPPVVDLARYAKGDSGGDGGDPIAEKAGMTSEGKAAQVARLKKYTGRTPKTST